MKTTNILLTSTLALFAVSADAAVETGDVIGTSETEIRAVLEGDGYDVQSIKFDEEEIEIDALFDGKEVEIELSSDEGAILEIEFDDDDGHETDDDDEIEDGDAKDDQEDDDGEDDND